MLENKPADHQFIVCWQAAAKSFWCYDKRFFEGFYGKCHTYCDIDGGAWDFTKHPMKLVHLDGFNLNR